MLEQMAVGELLAVGGLAIETIDPVPAFLEPRALIERFIAQLLQRAAVVAMTSSELALLGAR